MPTKQFVSDIRYTAHADHTRIASYVHVRHTTPCGIVLHKIAQAPTLSVKVANGKLASAKFNLQLAQETCHDWIVL